MLSKIDTIDIAHRIDHTILKPDVTQSEIEQLCREAKENLFAAVCIPPVYVGCFQKDYSDFLYSCKVVEKPKLG